MGLMNSYEAKLMECFASFEFSDLVGFAKIMQVDPELIKKAIGSAAVFGDKALQGKEWEELIVTTVESFSKLGRKERREVLKLAKEIKKNNDENNRVKEQDTSPQE